MGQPVKPASSTARVLRGHGYEGHVQLFATVPPYLKDELAETANARGLTLREAIEQAIRNYIQEAR